MMESVRQTIVSLGVPGDHVSTEEFVSPKAEPNGVSKAERVGAAIVGSLVEGQVARVTFSASNQMIDIDPSVTILEAAEQAGVSLPFECRSGICGQCKVRCTSGRVRMDSRDAITKSEESEGFILACQSHPIDEAITIEV